MPLFVETHREGVSRARTGTARHNRRDDGRSRTWVAWGSCVLGEQMSERLKQMLREIRGDGIWNEPWPIGLREP